MPVTFHPVCRLKRPRPRHLDECDLHFTLSFYGLSIMARPLRKAFCNSAHQSGRTGSMYECMIDA
jgi:hypothetical protein